MDASQFEIRRAELQNQINELERDLVSSREYQEHYRAQINIYYRELVKSNRALVRLSRQVKRLRAERDQARDEAELLNAGFCRDHLLDRELPWEIGYVKTEG